MKQQRKESMQLVSEFVLYMSLSCLFVDWTPSICVDYVEIRYFPTD